jgi:hypothetical protein
VTATGILRPGAAPPPPPPGAEVGDHGGLAAGVIEARVHVPTEIPRTRVRGRMRLLSRAESRAVRQEARIALATAGLGEAAKSHTPELYREWIEELATRTLAVAVRDSATLGPLAPLEEWEACDDDQIGALWERYKDLERELDPLGAIEELDPATEAAIVDAAKKKDARSLIAFGSSVLASFVTSSVCPPAS